MQIILPTVLSAEWANQGTESMTSVQSHGISWGRIKPNILRDAASTWKTCQVAVMHTLPVDASLPSKSAVFPREDPFYLFHLDQRSGPGKIVKIARIPSSLILDSLSTYTLALISFSVKEKGDSSS